MQVCKKVHEFQIDLFPASDFWMILNKLMILNAPKSPTTFFCDYTYYCCIFLFEFLSLLWNKCIFLWETKNLGQYWKFLTIIRFWVLRVSYEFLKGFIRIFDHYMCPPEHFKTMFIEAFPMSKHHSSTFWVTWYRKQVKRE